METIHVLQLMTSSVVGSPFGLADGLICLHVSNIETLLHIMLCPSDFQFFSFHGILKGAKIVKVHHQLF